MKLVVGVDIGTTNIKVIACDPDRKVVFRLEEPCSTIQTAPELSEQDPEAVLQSVNRLLKKVFINVSQDQVVAVSFSAAMHSLIAVDAQGDFLTNAILWGDTRSYKEEKELKDSGSAEILYRETGVPIHPSLPICKIIWLKKNKPQIFEQTAKFVSLKEYIYYKLFGIYIVDYAIAGATGMLNIHTLNWSEQALKVAGITVAMLSEIVPSTHAENNMPEPTKKLLGLSKSIPFVCGSSDGCLANIGTGVVDDTKAALTIGTSGAVRTTLPTAHINKKPTLFCYPLTDTIYVKGGAINNGAFVLQWLIKDLLKCSLTNEVYNRLLTDAATVEAGSDDLIFLPYLKGERAPIWNARAKGVFFGLNSMHEQHHLVKAVIEGVSYSLYDVFCEMADFEKNIQEIYVSGGFIKSRLWVQVIADIFNKKVIVSDAADASAIGAAYIGFYAMGIFRTLKDMPVNADAEQIFYPNKHNNEVYMTGFRKYQSIYQALKNEFN